MIMGLFIKNCVSVRRRRTKLTTHIRGVNIKSMRVLSRIVLIFVVFFRVADPLTAHDLCFNNESYI